MLHGNVNENYRKGDRLSSSRISSNDHRFFRYIFYYIIVQCLRNLGGGPQLYEDTIPFFIHRILTYSGHQLEIKPLSGG